MRCYRILYVNEKGDRALTFFGDPLTSLSLSEDDLYSYVQILFSRAHPNCHIIEITKGVYSEDNFIFLKGD